MRLMCLCVRVSLYDCMFKLTLRLKMLEWLIIFLFFNSHSLKIKSTIAVKYRAVTQTSTSICHLSIWQQRHMEQERLDFAPPGNSHMLSYAHTQTHSRSREHAHTHTCAQLRMVALVLLEDGEGCKRGDTQTNASLAFHTALHCSALGFQAALHY